MTNFVGRVLESPYMVAILLPAAFIVLEILMNKLAMDPAHREGDEGERKYCVWFKEDGNRKRILPLEISGLREELNKHKDVTDVDILAPGILETSLAVDLFAAALSSNFINFLVIPDVAKLENNLAETQRFALYVFILVLIALLACAYIIRRWRNHESRKMRVFIIQFTNILGGIAMFSVFYILGGLLIS